MTMLAVTVPGAPGSSLIDICWTSRIPEGAGARDGDGDGAGGETVSAGASDGDGDTTGDAAFAAVPEPPLVRDGNADGISLAVSGGSEAVERTAAGDGSAKRRVCAVSCDATHVPVASEAATPDVATVVATTRSLEGPRWRA
jgi:hypothetical protein